MYLKAVSAREMKTADRLAMEKYNISTEQLIENAADALYSECPPVKSAVIFAGAGNNGADGCALARRLFLSGTEVKIITLAEIDNGLVKTAELLGIKIYDFYEKPECDAELCVDAVFGTGLTREVTGKAGEMIDCFNSLNGFKLSVDIPSGVCADTGRVMGKAVRADKTVTFAFAKAGLYQYPGKELAGEVVIKDIFLPDSVGDTKKYIVKSAHLEKRRPNTHKGCYGHLLTLTGSAGMAGAACLAATAAVKSGCGLVTCGVPGVIFDTAAAKLSEAMTVSLPSNSEGFLREAAAAAEEHIKKASAILIGCGIRNNSETAYFVREVIERSQGKSLIIDADALNVLASSPEYLKGAIITPHPGEMARLMQTSVASVEEDRMNNALSFAESYGCTVVLKGAATVTAYPDGRAYINCGGNPGMANGGSGDALAGITASFAAQKIPEAAVKAVWAHSLAGDLAAEEYSENAMSAGDIIKMLPGAIKSMYEQR